MVDERVVSKAGILPVWWEKGEPRFFLMLPKSLKPELGPAEWQIAKGGRRVWRAGQGWVDTDTAGAAGESLEPVLEAALREGEEELGLKRDNIKRLWDAGVCAFTSAQSGTPKYMYLFVAGVKDPLDFLAPHQLDAKTESVAWMGVRECAGAARADHFALLERIDHALGAFRQR